LLDERFFLVFEDVDWSYRAREAGFKLIFVPEAILWHKTSGSFGGSGSPYIGYFHTRNRLLWGKKHLSRRDFFLLCRAIYSELMPLLRLPPLPIDPQRNASVIKKLYWACLQYPADIGKWLSGVRRELTTGHVRACLYGARDFVLGRFGEPDVGIVQRFGRR
jgi:GT2 family glycosyltransferase